MKPTFDKKRPLSWSAISSFEYNKEQWYESYVLGKKQSSREMDFGSKVDKQIQTDLTFLPELPRYELMQYKMTVMFGKIPLIGLPDGLDLNAFLLADYKTGKKAWDKKRADETGQLTMYLFLVYIQERILPEKFRCFIHWLPTQDNGDFTISFTTKFAIQTFETRRTMKDLLDFGKRIKKVYKEMEDYCQNHA